MNCFCYYLLEKEEDYEKMIWTAVWLKVKTHSIIAVLLCSETKRTIRSKLDSFLYSLFQFFIFLKCLFIKKAQGEACSCHGH